MALVHKWKNKRNSCVWQQDLRNWITIRHTQVGHSVERQATDHSLGGLSFQQASRALVPKDGFQSEHDGFCQRTNVVA